MQIHLEGFLAPIVKLTYENQGYRDRLHRAESWITRAENLKEQEWDDYHGPFIAYWIAFNALYGRHHETRGKKEIEDLNWFLSRICELDQADSSLSERLRHLKSKTDRLIKDKFLSRPYWEEGLSPRFKKIQEEDFKKAQTAYEREKFDGYLSILFERLQVLRNQIFHGCSTDRRSLNKNSLRAALEIIEELVPRFLKIFKDHGQGYDWPKIPYPRAGSPQHPK